MRLRTIHKVYKDAESQQLGQMSQEEYDKLIVYDIAGSIAKIIFDKGRIPIIKHDSTREHLGIDNENPFFQYECEFILLSRSEFEKISEALITIKNTL